MSSIDAFLSCSFDKNDEEIVKLIRGIATALGFIVTNVSSGAPQTPPEVARAKIGSAQCLIAICTKRDELKDGGYVMPQAVQDEVAIAYGTDTPTIMLVETGVQVVGFKPNFGTYASFDRASLTDSETISNIVAALNNLRAAINDSKLSLGPQGLSGSYAEYVHHLAELEPEDGDYIWQYSTTKKLVYTHSTRGSFPVGVWATLPGIVPDNAPPIDWSVETASSTNGIKVLCNVEKHTANCVEGRLRLEPPPEANDFVEYITQSRSRYLNPVWEHEAQGPHVHLDHGQLKTYDGLIFIHRTQKAILEFRFARSYGMKATDVIPFVGSYTQGVDYEVRSELDRANVRVENFAGSIVARIEIDSPVPNLFYGFAWNPRRQPLQIITKDC